MSRTNKTTEGPKNPSTKFLEWKSTERSWAYWDKATEQEILIAHDGIPFIVLDQLNTVKGFDEKAQSGIWSNEVRSVGKDELTVRTRDGIKCQGLYKDIKSADIRFTKSVYAMARIAGDYDLVNFQLSGAALGAWFEFSDQSGDLEGDIVIGVTGTTEGKKGAVTFNTPNFAIVATELSPEAASRADALDGQLQAYLAEYLSRREEPQGPRTVANSEPAITHESEAEAETFRPF